MDDNNDKVVSKLQIRPWLYRCLYFCPQFYEAYQNKAKIDGVFVRLKGHEAVFICKKCRVTLSEYISFESLIFFQEIRNMLIEFFIPMHESARQIVVEV